MHLSPEKEALFPNLRREDYRVTSESDWRYNCIAHAAGKKDAPWWPADEGTEGVFWPEGIAREESLACFVAAYGTLGYVPCDNADLEAGFEKVALYVDGAGIPTHAAKQLASGAWTSKLGDWEDIEHQILASLEEQQGAAPAYGKVTRLLKRPWREAADVITSGGHGP
jgi:hypothetical protein